MQIELGKYIADRIKESEWWEDVSANAPISRWRVNSAYWTKTLDCGYLPYIVSNTMTWSSCGVSVKIVSVQDGPYDPSRDLVPISSPTTLSAIYTHAWHSAPYKSGAYWYHAWFRAERWQRKTGAPSPTPVVVPATWVPLPSGRSIANPLAWPVASPAPRLLPYAKPTPAEQPSKSPEPKPNRRPRRDPRPRRLPPVRGLPLVTVGPMSVPIAPPSIVVRPGQNPTSPTVTEVPPPNTNAPPRSIKVPGAGRPRQRPKVEKKAKMSALGHAIWAGVNTTTEVLDFVNAMAKSIPASSGHALSPKASKMQRLRYMFTHPEAWLEIDLGMAIENYVNMQVGDYVAAFGSGAIKNLTQQLGIATGLDGAIRRAGDTHDEARPEGVEAFNPVPQLDYDEETGAWSISGPLGVLKVIGGK